MDRERFEWFVAKAVEDLPEEFLTSLQNVDVVVEERPTSAQVGRARLRLVKHCWASMRVYPKPGGADTTGWYYPIR